MSSAMGVLRWPPETFWKATMYEYTAAMKGYLVSKGIDLTPGITVEEVKELQALHEKRIRKAQMRGQA